MAQEKVDGLRACGAHVTVVAPVVAGVAYRASVISSPRASSARRSLAIAATPTEVNRRGLRRRRASAGSSATSPTSPTLLVHPAGDPPARPDHRRRLDRRRVAGARAAAARPLRGAGRLEHARARGRAARIRPWVKQNLAHVRGAPRLLPRARRGGARMSVALVGAGPGRSGADHGPRPCARSRVRGPDLRPARLARSSSPRRRGRAADLARRHRPGRRQRAARRARPARAPRRAPQGRRPVRVRPRRGGGARARPRRRCRSSSCPACLRSPPFPSRRASRSLTAASRRR